MACRLSGAGAVTIAFEAVCGHDAHLFFEPRTRNIIMTRQDIYTIVSIFSVIGVLAFLQTSML